MIEPQDLKPGAYLNVLIEFIGTQSADPSGDTVFQKGETLIVMEVVIWNPSNIPTAVIRRAGMKVRYYVPVDILVLSCRIDPLYSGQK